MRPIVDGPIMHCRHINIFDLLLLLRLFISVSGDAPLGGAAPRQALEMSTPNDNTTNIN